MQIPWIRRYLVNSLFRKQKALLSSQFDQNKGIMDRILLPDRVQGMVELDRDQFSVEVKVPVVRVSNKLVVDSLKVLKKNLFKVPGFNPVRSGEGYRDVYLVPGTIVDKNELETFNWTLSEETVKLGYENWRADQVLRAVIPNEFDSVSGYSQIGHIIHLNLKPELHPWKKVIGQVLLDKIKTATTVVSKTASIDNEFRNFEMELLAGDEDLVALVKENKTQFKLDFGKVYWNPRLSCEHERITKCLNKGDVLFDVFAGIGPFAVPCAKKGVRVYANDLNPESVKWMKENLLLNKTSASVFNKDGVDFIKEDIKSTILSLESGDYRIAVTMNLPALAIRFLPHFIALFDKEHSSKISELPRPRVYVYCFVKNAIDSKNEAVSMLEAQMNLTLTEDELVAVNFVRNVAPNKDMVRVTLDLSPRILLSNKRPLFEEQSEEKSKKACLKPIIL